MNKKREAEAAARAALETSKKEVEIANAEKKTLLAVSQSREKTYEQVLADRQAKAAQIKAVLFPLRDAGPISFGTALVYAQEANRETGVRAAFILGIFATESGKGSDGTFGRNVGQCLLTNTPNKGDGKGRNTGTFFSQVMKGTRDVDPFLEIIKKLGLDPYSQPVSCPSLLVTAALWGRHSSSRLHGKSWEKDFLRLSIRPSLTHGIREMHLWRQLCILPI